MKVKSKSGEYFYLRVSERLRDGKGTKRDRNIFKFGSKENAIKNISIWEESMDFFPPELKNMGYNLNDLRSWKEQILNK